MSVRNAVVLIVVLELLSAALAISHFGYTLEGLLAVTRYSGRLSLAIFSIIFILLPVHDQRLSAVLSSHYFLVFAIAHGIHLLQLLGFVYLSGNELIPIRLAGGFLAYAFIFAMPVIHHYTKTGKVSDQKFRWAQSVYLYYVWFIFFMSYLPRVQGKLPNVGGNYSEFVVLLCWVCALLGMKLPALIFPSKRTGTP
ncbi:MAG TPA: hypothetical protein PLV21_13870 [Cyclobacteriaceae bacterium]|nr:hypothetical protein [Cyclobacteriaceae bacterium]HRJ82974.1 hypothetical protein [Cyclobacteriaceae bacterium]